MSSEGGDRTFKQLEAQDVREYWRNEEEDFTPWLERQLNTEGTSDLEDVLELDVEVIQREKSVGRYSVDIYAETVDDGRGIIIENQLNTSDHDHLGKALAYAAGVDAEIIVWIAPTFNDEHRDAFQWLNENSRQEMNLFALRLEVWKIGDSAPAVRLNPVAEPSEWKEAVKRTGRELTETDELKEEFWTAFRNRVRDGDNPLSPRKPKPQHWYNNPIGKTGFALTFKMNTQENLLEMGLLIRDDDDAYHALAEHKETIEAQFDTEIEWREPAETRAGKQRSQIVCTRKADITNQDSWDKYLDWLLTYGTQFHDEFYDRVRAL